MHLLLVMINVLCFIMFYSEAVIVNARVNCVTNYIFEVNVLF